MRNILRTAVIAALAFGIAGAASADTATFSGTLTGTPDYHRPSYTNSYTPAFNCTDCGFYSEEISVSTTGNYIFSLVSSDFPDVVGILYQGAFDPTDPMTNFVGPLSHAMYGVYGNSAMVSLTANTQYSWVTSTDFGYSADDCDAGCAFTTSVTGPGVVTAGVPEPATWAMMIVGFGSLGVTLRTRRRWAVSQA